MPVDGDVVVNGGPQTLMVDIHAEINVSRELSKLGESGRSPNFVQARFHTLDIPRFGKTAM